MEQPVYIGKYLQDGDKFIDSKKRVWTCSITIGRWKRDYWIDSSTYVDCKCNLLKNVAGKLIDTKKKAEFDIEINMHFENTHKVVSKQEFIDFIENKLLIKVSK
jgi:hypothetical protein